MNYLRRIDDFVFDRCLHPVTWRIEYYTGVNNFQIERICLGVSAVACLLLAISGYQRNWESAGAVNPIFLVAAPFMVLGCALLAALSYQIEKEERRCEGTRNSNRGDTLLLVFRVLFLLLAGLSWGLLAVATESDLQENATAEILALFALFITAFMVAGYLLAADPLPPSQRYGRVTTAKAAAS